MKVPLWLFTKNTSVSPSIGAKYGTVVGADFLVKRPEFLARLNDFVVCVNFLFSLGLLSGNQVPFFDFVFLAIESDISRSWEAFVITSIVHLVFMRRAFDLGHLILSQGAFLLSALDTLLLYLFSINVAQ